MAGASPFAPRGWSQLAVCPLFFFIYSIITFMLFVLSTMMEFQFCLKGELGSSLERSVPFLVSCWRKGYIVCPEIAEASVELKL